MTCSFQAARQLCQPPSDLTRDARRFTGRIERKWVEPDALETGPDLGLCQILELDAVATRIGEWSVSSTGSREFGIEFDAGTHVHNDDEWWTPLSCRQCPSVFLSLTAGAQHRLVHALRLRDLAQLLGFEHESTAPVEVDPAGTRASVAMLEGHR